MAWRFSALGLCLLLGLAGGCNPFLAEKGAAGQPCLNDGTCKPGLFCFQGVCDSGWPDGGPDADGGGGDGGDAATDADAGDGDVDPCQEPSLDCGQAGLPGQGLDQDSDGWGHCCDCDDGKAAIHPLAAEDCNGMDDDCDQDTDEELQDVPCPLTDGVCAGATRSCQADGAWAPCDYGPAYTPAPDDSCDELDNDCDGQTDEDGVLRLEAEAGSLATDGLDNNCNGLVDESGGVMVPIQTRPGVWIDSYELTIYDNPDCTGQRFGEAADDYPAGWPAVDTGVSETLYACSLAGVIPSGHLSWYRAQRACAAQGKRLCAQSERESACTGGSFFFYPYGPGFIEGVCNDPYGGLGNPAPAGSFADCTAAGQFTWDMSGNLAEWVAEWNPDQVVHPNTALVAGGSHACILCWDGASCNPCDPEVAQDRTSTLNLLNCVVGDKWIDSFRVDQAYPYIGARCCLDGP